jgi:hypothetical protein
MRSGEESHVGLLHLKVRELRSRQNPLSKESLPLICREVIVEEGGVDGGHGVLLLVVIVSKDEGTLIVVRAINQVLNQGTVLLAPLFNRLLLVSEAAVEGSCHHSIELLNLVSISMLLDNNILRKVLDQRIGEILERVKLGFISASESHEKVVSLINSSSELSERFNHGVHVSCSLINLRDNSLVGVDVRGVNLNSGLISLPLGVNIMELSDSRSVIVLNLLSVGFVELVKVSVGMSLGAEKGRELTKLALDVSAILEG